MRPPAEWLARVATWPPATYVESLCARSWQQVLLGVVSEEHDDETVLCLPLAAEWVAAALSTWRHNFTTTTSSDASLASHLDGGLLLVDQCCDSGGQDINVNALHAATLTLRSFNHGQWAGWPRCATATSTPSSGNQSALPSSAGPPGGSGPASSNRLLAWFSGPYRRFFYADVERRILSGGGLALLLIVGIGAFLVLVLLIAFKQHSLTQRRTHRALAARLFQRLQNSWQQAGERL